VEGILSLILARPLGAPSLLQRFMAFVLNSEIDKIKKESQKPLEAEINDEEFCSRIKSYVSKGDRELTREMASRAEKHGEDILTSILLGSDSEARRDEIKAMEKAFAESNYRMKVDLAYPSSSLIGKSNVQKGLEGAGTQDARKFAQLKLYLRSALRIRDHQQALKVSLAEKMLFCGSAFHEAYPLFISQCLSFLLCR